MPERELNQEIAIDQIRSAFQSERFGQAIQIFQELHPGDQVGVFNSLEEPEREALIEHLDIDATADLFDRLRDSETLEAAESIPIERLADILEEMQPDEAADLLGDLPPEQASMALEEMEDAEDVLPLLGYPDETAGGRMTTEYIAMRRHTTAEQGIDFLRMIRPDHEVPYYVFVIDREKRLAGVVGLRELVVAAPNKRMEDIMDPDVIHVSAELDQEAVAQVMTRYDLSAVPVVDDGHHLVGVITHDDILDVLTEEATEDIYRLANVGNVELEPDSPIREHLRGRLPWLYLNTLTALFAAWVISNFESLIAQVAVLAVFQSVVAGLGGNGASQTIAVIVRSLALGKVSTERIWRVLGRELVVGLLQGLAVGIAVGVGVALWRGNVFLGFILGAALLGNMVVAGIAGAMVPLILKAFGKDPALASPVLVTAATDSMGFLIFLGLATLFVQYLQ